MADTHYYLGQGGAVWAYDLPLPETIEEKVTKGFLRRVQSDGSPWIEAQGEPPAAPSRPAVNAPKAEWVGYAVRTHSEDPEVADGMTKADLIEKYGRD
jgi:hypothetical protein